MVRFSFLPRSLSGHSRASEVAPKSGAVSRSALLGGPEEHCRRLIQRERSLGEPTKQNVEERRARLGRHGR